MARRKIELNCAVCQAVFLVCPSRLAHGRGKHCSPACQHESRRQAPKKEMVCACIGCGASFTREASRAKHKGSGKYCTRACRDKHWKGPLNPCWQNGSGVYKRGPHWQATRRRILARDKVCQHCGAGHKLHVHHRVPFRMFDDAAEANADDNLIALCPPCHRKEDARSKWVSVGGGVLRFNAGGVAWQMARDKGVV